MSVAEQMKSVEPMGSQAHAISLNVILGKSDLFLGQ